MKRVSLFIRSTLPGLLSTLAFISVWPRAALAQTVMPTVLTLTSDATLAPVHTLVNLTATVQGSTSITGSIIFTDGATPIVTLPVNAHGMAVLGIASLAAGTHTVSAVYSGDAANAASSSAGTSVTIVGLPGPFTISASSSTAYVNAPVTLTANGLPAAATGSISFLDNAANLATATLTGVSSLQYNAFGDSITAGQAVGAGQRYPDLFASNYGFTESDDGVAGSIACDVLPFELLQNGIGPTQANAPLSSLMVGSTEIDAYGSLSSPSYQTNFHTCQEAALVWLAIPREYKVLAGDAGATVSSGAWTSSPGVFDQHYGTLMNTSGSGVARFALTSNGGPIYLWYLLGDSLPGTFTLAIDGVASPTIYNTQPSPAIGSFAHPGSVDFALLRFPLGAGPHTFDVTVQSGTVGILGIATPPSPGGASVHPTVLVSDVPSQLATNPLGSPEVIAAYTQDIEATVAQLLADGLDVRLIPTRQFMLGAANEMTDQVNPNALGQAHLAQAFESVFGSSPTAPYASVSGAAAITSVSFNSPGTHIVNGSYSGDSTYAAGSATAAVSINVLPQTVSTTSLFTLTTNYFYGAPVLLTASVVPATATGTVTFFDGTSYLGQVPVTNGVASLTTSSLALGLHSMTVGYSGDLPDTASASPVLMLQINPVDTVVTLGTVPATAAYGTIPSIIATVVPASATGTITFRDSVSGSLGQVAISNGMASVGVASLAPGEHTFTATYSGDATDLAATSAPISTVLTAIVTSTTLTASPTHSTFGGAATLVATVSPASATGTVVFRDSIAGVLGSVTIANGYATLSTTALTPGAHALTAIYSGDAVDGASSSLAVTLTVGPVATSIVISPPAGTLYAGNAVSISASVVPASATGTVTFRDVAAGTLGQAAVAHGTATITLGSLAVGSYSISAAYSGDSDNAPAISAAAVTQVSLNPTVTTLGLVASSIPYSTVVTLTARVSPAGAGLVQPGGVVQFFDGGNAVGQGFVNNGVASAQISALTTGVHVLRATYNGDSLEAPSTSATASTTITPDNTSTSLALAQVNVPVGLPVIFNVRVASLEASIPSGTVSIRTGATVLASGPLVSSVPGVGYATLSINSAMLGPGSFAVAAFYSGDGSDTLSDSTATPATFTVAATPTTSVLTLSAMQVPLQAPVTLSTVTSSANSMTPTGSMTFFSNGKVLATVPLDAAGAASMVLGTQPVGTYTLSATYSPTGVFAGDSAAPRTLNVTPPLTLSLTPVSINAAPGTTQTATLALTPLSGFSGAIHARCQTSEPFMTCSIDAPATVSGPANALVHVTVAQTTAANVMPITPGSAGRLAAALAVLLPLVLPRRRVRQKAGSILTLIVLVAFSGCALGGNFGTVPAGSQTVLVTVTAAGADMTASMTVQITN